MNYIKSIYIMGFKKFNELNVLFNEHMNILVGDNEAGKSTVLEAIKLVLFQQYRNADKAILKDLFNQGDVARFKASPCIENLPSIYIEVVLSMEPKSKDAEYFYGEVNRDEAGNYGIAFSCEFDKELGSGLESQIREGIVETYEITL